ncbi:MAG TPA: hypothetical protein PK110_02615 [Niabella sp.]|nr:hypothetical protein [Niabella sp.]
MKKAVSILVLMMIITCVLPTNAQVVVKGTVYDSIGTTPIQAVSVLSSSGKGTITNEDGHYYITLSEADSIWFSYLNKPTRKFAVKDIQIPYAFDISIKIHIPLLPEAKVRNRDYKRDSIQNRIDYAKAFDFQRPGLSAVSGTGTAGFDLVEIINAFRFRRTRSMLSFQRGLIEDEQEAFVKHRFSKALIRRITEMDSDSLINLFVLQYRPSYLFTSMASDYDFHRYIKLSYNRFKLGLRPPPLWREGEVNDDY